MTRDQAITYLYSSGMSDEQVNTVVEALSQVAREEFEYAIKSCGFFILWGQTYYEKSELIKAFEDMGLIEQKPKTGHWIWQTENIYRCSECGEDIFVKEVMNVPQYKCCPMCMAKMVEPQERNDEE